MERNRSVVPRLLIRNLDYYLLACFDVIMTERHVTRAAEKLDLSQPAMSGILARLREIFGDTLLLRGAHGMVPTPRATELHQVVRSVLRQLETALGGSSFFDPATAKITFRLMLSDFAQSVLLPAVASRIQIEAPGIDLDLKPANTRKVGEFLENGEIDLGIGYLPEAPEMLRTRELFRERFVCIVRRGNADSVRLLDASMFAKARHLVVAPGGVSLFGALLDQRLAKLKLRRRTPLVVPNYFVAPFIVAKSDLIALLPMRIATLFSAYLPLEIIEPPVDMPEYRVSMYWHDRTHLEPSHQWLRQLFLGVTESLERDLAVAPLRNSASQNDEKPAARRVPRASKKRV